MAHLKRFNRGNLEVLPSGHPVVLVGFDDTAPKRFLLDTAASMTAILPRLSATAAARPLNGAGGAAQIKGATQHAITSSTAPLDTLSIGDVAIAKPTVRIAELPVFGVLGLTADQPAVILGIDMFRDRRFVIDHAGLRPAHLTANTGSGACTILTESHHHVEIDPCRRMRGWHTRQRGRFRDDRRRAAVQPPPRSRPSTGFRPRRSRACARDDRRG